MLYVQLGVLLAFLQVATAESDLSANYEVSTKDLKVGQLSSFQLTAGLCAVDVHRAQHAVACGQMALLDTVFGTERGLDASSDARAEINEIISQLEAKNPTPSPNEVGRTVQHFTDSWELEQL